MNITRATLKSFINKNRKNLYVDFRSSFDGMTDCVQSLNGGMHKAQPTNEHLEYSLGIEGAWFVGRSRDHFIAFENDSFTGYKVSNCCGSFVLAIQKLN